MKKMTRNQFRTYWENLPGDQKKAELLKQINLNLAHRKIGMLPARLRSLTYRLWRAMKYQQPEDIETVIKIAKAHGIGPFKKDSPTTENDSFSSDTHSIEQRGQA